MTGPPPSNEPESTLLQTRVLLSKIRAGDREARSDLFERYRRPLERYLHARLPDAARRVADTQDFAQEVSLRALGSLDRFEYRGIGSFWAYIRTIAHHYVIEVSKKAGRDYTLADATEETEDRVSVDAG